MKKPGIAIGLVVPGKSKPEPQIEQSPMEGDEDDGMAEAKRTAMSSYMDALQGDDVDAALSAYEHLNEVCGY